MVGKALGVIDGFSKIHKYTFVFSPKKCLKTILLDGMEVSGPKLGLIEGS